MPSLTAPPRLQTVIVVLDVAGRQVGLPITIVQDVVKVQRSGPGGAWRVHRAAVAAICPAGMLAVGDRCVPLVELSEQLGMAPVSFARRLRSVVVVQSAEHVVGLLVDGVADIVEAPCSAIRPVAPSAGQHPAMRQIARFDDREIELLDFEQLLGERLMPLNVRQLR
jgi:purine-binding chemotaxis protein CheW